MTNTLRFPATAQYQQPSWLLLQVKPGQELRAHENIENQGAASYCPQIEMEKITRGKRICSLEPLFPGYLFVQVPTADQSALSFTAMRSTRGVSKIVRFGSEFTTINNEVIETVKQRVLNQTAPITKDLPKAGDKIQIIDGPFKGLEAVYQQASGEVRSMVLISILHKQALMAIDNTQLAS